MSLRLWPITAHHQIALVHCEREERGGIYTERNREGGELEGGGRVKRGRKEEEGRMEGQRGRTIGVGSEKQQRLKSKSTRS